MFHRLSPTPLGFQNRGTLVTEKTAPCCCVGIKGLAELVKDCRNFPGITLKDGKITRKGPFRAKAVEDPRRHRSRNCAAGGKSVAKQPTGRSVCERGCPGA